MCIFLWSLAFFHCDLSSHVLTSGPFSAWRKKAKSIWLAGIPSASFVIMDGVECIHALGAGGTPVQTFFLILPDPNQSVYYPNTFLLPAHGGSSFNVHPVLSKQAFQSNAPFFEPLLSF